MFFILLRQVQSLISYMLVVILSLPFSALLLADIQPQAVPGGIHVQRLYEASQTQPYVTFDDHPALVFKKNNYWHALIGIGLSEKRKMLSLMINSKHQRQFVIADKTYPSSNVILPISKKKYIQPDPSLNQRIVKERQLLANIFNEFNAIQAMPKNFIKPVRQVENSGFGLRRLYNGEFSSQHRGSDMAAPIGTPISASAEGKVVLVADLYYTGLTVVIDHGQGLYSLYAHLSASALKQQQWIKQGELLGKVGESGRASGPHLHFAFILNSARVNPNLFY